MNDLEGKNRTLNSKLEQVQKESQQFELAKTQLELKLQGQGEELTQKAQDLEQY